MQVGGLVVMKTVFILWLQYFYWLWNISSIINPFFHFIFPFGPHFSLLSHEILDLFSQLQVNQPTQIDNEPCDNEVNPECSVEDTNFKERKCGGIGLIRCYKRRRVSASGSWDWVFLCLHSFLMLSCRLAVGHPNFASWMCKFSVQSIRSAYVII